MGRKERVLERFLLAVFYEKDKTSACLSREISSIAAIPWNEGSSKAEFLIANLSTGQTQPISSYNLHLHGKGPANSSKPRAENTTWPNHLSHKQFPSLVGLLLCPTGASFSSNAQNEESRKVARVASQEKCSSP